MARRVVWAYPEERANGRRQSTDEVERSLLRDVQLVVDRKIDGLEMCTVSTKDVRDVVEGWVHQSDDRRPSRKVVRNNLRCERGRVADQRPREAHLFLARQSVKSREGPFVRLTLSH